MLPLSHRRSRFPLIALLLGLEALAPAGSAQARRASSLPAALERAGSLEEGRQAVTSGAAGWSQYLRWLRGNRQSVFERAELRANARQGKFSILERDHKIAVLRDLKALRSVEGRPVEEEHLLGIPTWGRVQPTWVSSIAPKDAAALGRLGRTTLERPREQPDGRARETYGYFHMPGGISQPVTHFHSKWRPEAMPSTVRDWDGFLSRNYRRTRGPDDGSYRLYRVKPGASVQAQAWPVLAVADPAWGRPSTLSERSDRVLGRMFIALAGSAIRTASPALMTGGELQIDRAESRLVVRLASSPP
jgi:hypothetical protein